MFLPNKSICSNGCLLSPDNRAKKALRISNEMKRVAHLLKLQTYSSKAGIGTSGTSHVRRKSHSVNLAAVLRLVASCSLEHFLHVLLSIYYSQVIHHHPLYRIQHPRIPFLN